MKKIKSYWKKIASNVIWQKYPKKILKWQKNRYFWFPDGRINIAENCLLNSKNKEKRKNAIVFIDKNKNISKLNYFDLANKVNHFSNYLRLITKNKTIKNVVIHSSANKISAISMLSLSKLGIHFSVIFDDLPNNAIYERLKLINPDVIITKNISKIKFFKKYINKNKNLKRILICSGKKISQQSLFYYNFDKKEKKQSINYDHYESNNKLFTLFTSGSTGVPKGIQHSSAPYLVYSKHSSFKKFGMNKNSIVLTASDAGWINGHTYSLFGPLSFGATTILVESPFILLDYLFLYKIIKEFKITILYLPVTLLRLLKGVIPISKKMLKHKIKALGSMGEPLAASIAEWYSLNFFGKKKAIVNTYFQTETGGIISAPSYDEAGSSTYGTVGTTLSKYIKYFKSQKNKFELELINPWPGCMIDVINGNNYWRTYWRGRKFKLFDYGSFIRKNLIVHGRTDDVINIRGHRLGSGEVESKVLEIKEIIEACAISISDKIEGSSLILFVVTSKINQSEMVKNKIKDTIYDYFGTYALPKKIYFIKELPKTRSGKILRRVLRQISVNKKTENLGDLSTILNKQSIDKIKKIIR